MPTHQPSRRSRILCLCLLAFAGNQPSQAETLLALTSDARLLQLGTDGRVYAEQTIRTPVSPDRLRGIALSDIDPRHAGRELVVIRTDNHLEIYPAPFGADSTLQRLAFHHLPGAAADGLTAFAIQNDNSTGHLHEIITSGCTEDASYRMMIHEFPTQPGIHLPRILDFEMPASAGLKKAELAAIDPASSVIVRANKAGDFERIGLFTTTPSAGAIKGRVTLAPGDAIQAIALHGDRLYAVTSKHQLLTQTILRDGRPANTNQFKLKAGYDVVALFVDDSPPAVLPRHEVQWSPPDTAGYQYADVAALLPAQFSFTKQLSPLSLSSGQASETQVTRINLPTVNKHTVIPIPMGIALPDDTKAVAVWLKAANPGYYSVRFVFGDENGTFVVTEGNPEGVAPTPPQWAVRYSTEARINDWTLRQVYLTGEHQGLSLQRIEIVPTRADEQLALLGPRITVQATPRAEATLVWKLKDFVLPKHSSLNWTATHYYEYGYDRSALLPTAAWMQSLHGRDKTSDRALPHRLDIQLRAANGEPLKHWTLDQAALAAPIALPRLPEGSWFLDLSARNEQDAIAAQGRVVYQTLRDDSGGSPSAAKPAMSDDSTRPFMLEGIVYDGASTTVGSPLEARLLVKPLSGWTNQPLSADWTIRATDGATVSSGTSPISTENQEAKLSLPANQPGAYTVTAKLVDASGKLLDQFQETYGVGSSAMESGEVSAVKYQRPPLNYGAVASISLASTHYDPDQIQRLPTHTFPALNEWAKTASMACGILQKWHGTTEPVKGCYQWRFMDSELSKVQEMGIDSVWTGIGYTGDGLPEWLWFEELMDQHQQTIQAEYHYVSPFGPRFRAARNRLNAELLTHYRDNPGLAGVMLYCGPSEGYLTDTGSMISGYSPAARNAFRSYLKNKYRSDLRQLNRKWDSDFRTWDQVAPPLPDWSQSWEASAAWWDFHSFKADWVIQDVGDFFAQSRATAPDLPMMSYGKEGFGGTGRLAPVFRENRIRYSNGGGETLAAYVQTSIMRNHGVPANPEGHYVMPNIGSVSMVIANSLFAGQYQGQNIMWGLVWTKTPHVGVPEYAAVARLTTAIDRHAEEMNRTRPLQPWAAYFGATRAMLESRSFRNPLNNEANLIAGMSGGQLHNLCSWVDDGSELAALNRYRLIVDSGAHVLAPESLPVLLDYVAAGGTFVATTDTARYLAGDSTEVNALLYDKLGAVRIDRSVQGGSVSDPTQILRLSRLDEIEWNPRLPHPPKALLTTSEGQPLLWEVLYGRGRFWVLSGSPDWSKSAGWVQALANATVGPQPYSIDGERIVARPLRGPDADYLVLVAVMPDRGFNHSAKTLDAAPKSRVKIKGLPASLTAVNELITDDIHTVSAGVLEFETTPGMVRIIKIPRSTP